MSAACQLHKWHKRRCVFVCAYMCVSLCVCICTWVWKVQFDFLPNAWYLITILNMSMYEITGLQWSWIKVAINHRIWSKLRLSSLWLKGEEGLRYWKRFYNILIHLSKWYILDEYRCMGTFYGRVKLSEGIFWVGGGWVEIFYG